MNAPREQVTALLTAMGVTGAEEDRLLDIALTNAQNAIQNAINQPEIPDGLSMVLVYRTAGEYLLMKQGAGQLEQIGLVVDAAVKQIQEGDTNTVFALGEGDQTPEQRLNQLIDWLRTAGADQFARFRKLVW